MSNVASGFDDSTVLPLRETGFGSHPAQQNDHGSGKIEADDGPSGNQAVVEGSHVNGVLEDQDGHLCSGNIMQEAYCDGKPAAQVGDSEMGKLTEENADIVQHVAQPDLMTTGEPQGGASGLYGPNHGDQSILQTLEEGHVDGKAENASSGSSTLPWLEKPPHAQTFDESWVQDSLANHQDTVSQNQLGRLTDLPPRMTSDKHPPHNTESAQESRNVGSDDRYTQVHSDASVMAPMGTWRGYTHEDEGANETLVGSIGMGGEHTHDCNEAYGTPGKCSSKSTPAHGSQGQHAGHGSFASADVFVEGGQLERHPQKSMFGNGSILSGCSYSLTKSGSMKKIGIVSRFGSAIFSLVAFSVIISTNEKRVAAGSTFYVKFSDYQAYNYLAALNLLSFLYSTTQVAFRAQARSSNILTSPVKRGASVYLCDQMLALLMMSSSSSAATASELSRHGLHNIWPPACSTWKLSLFCSRAEVAVAMSFASFLFMLLSSFSSGYYLSSLLAE